MRQILSYCLALVITCFSATGYAFSVIRDTEVEETLMGYIRPIFKAAGLKPSEAEVVIVNDPTINAFVAGGQTIFVHTGLILKAKNPDELVFVLSHETGHIAGGHVVRGYQAMEKAQTTALISTVIGGILAVASGHPDAGIALMMGGHGSAEGMFAKYRQTEESSADRVAVDILGRLGYSMSGFEGIMKTIKSEDRLNDSEVYLRTHPVTQTRINELSRFLKAPIPVHSERAFDMMQAKLSGFLEKPEKTLQKYHGLTVVDAYAQAIASYKKREFTKAFQQIDGLIEIEPDNPYFYELKGQLLFETGHLSESADMYGRAYQLKRESDLIALSYAQVLLELGGVENAQKAEKLLLFVCQKDPDTLFAWQLLGKAYDRQNKKVEADYATAEYERVSGRIRQAQERAKRIIEKVPKGSPMYQRLQDILDRKDDE